MATMISGSIAYDNILSYAGRFSDHLIAESLDHINLTFVTESMTRNYGGCAANIAYALKMLGGDPVVVGAVGTDGNDYLYRFEEAGIKTSVVKFNDCYTAQCFVTTDTTGSQLATFNPGAMQRAHQAPFPTQEKIDFALVGPDGKEAMIARMNECVEKGIPVLFDIGQGVSLFNGDEIRDLISKATYMAASAYEIELIERKTGLRPKDVAALVKALIVTLGEDGSCVYVDGEIYEVPASRVDNAIDPVGAGDAYRGGLLYGLTRGWDWVKCLRVASCVAAFKVQSMGAQNYKFDTEALKARYEHSYGEKLDI
ncbi:MAG: carbohydrate kinase family protein [Sutterellaceae bacterium]|nr:carbohydrate kinase family protein [Sutterellaceae bacterium]